MDTLKTLKNNKLIFIFRNFSSIVYYNGDKIVFDILDYIEKIKNSNSVEELDKIVFEYIKPKSFSDQFDYYVSETIGNKYTAIYIDKVSKKEYKAHLEIDELLSKQDQVILNAPKLFTNTGLSLVGINQYIDGKISYVYSKYVLGTIDESDSFESLISNEIKKISNNQIENTTIQKLVSSYINKVEVL